VTDDDRRWLVEGEREGTTLERALAFFDGRPPVTVTELTGRWRGAELRTGHPLQGLLPALGWYGKELIDAETVHPLLFHLGGEVRPLNPALMPIGLVLRAPALFRTRVAAALFRAVGPLLATHRPTARLRMLVHREVLSAAMVYDALPIVDCFRRVDADTLLGLMDLRGMDAPFFFLLRRE
jgi:hypothetical protein